MNKIYLSTMSIKKWGLIFTLLLSINLTAKEKQVGYYDSPTVMSHAEIWSDAKKTLHEFDSVRTVTISDMEKNYLAQLNDFEVSKETMSDNERVQSEENLHEMKAFLDYKKEAFSADSKIMIQRLYEPILNNLREAISILTKRYNLSVLLSSDKLNDADKLTSLDLTKELIAEIIRLEKRRKFID